MADRFVIHPLNRGTRPVKVTLQTEFGKVTGAEIGTTFYWDFAKSLRDKDPLDAIHLTQRISGTESCAHAIAAARALEEIVQAKISPSARILRNILLGFEMIYGHINHFYQSVLPDYLPFPGAEHISDSSGDFRIKPDTQKIIMDHVWRSYDIRRTIQEAIAIIGGRAPHSPAIIVGGLMHKVKDRDILSLEAIVDSVADFVNNEYTYDIYQMKRNYPELFDYGRSENRLLSIGEFPQNEQEDYFWPKNTVKNFQPQALDLSKITIENTGSWFEPELDGNFEDPLEMRLKTLPDKKGGYTWVKGALYEKGTYEVGAMARMIAANNQNIAGLGAGANSIMGRLRSRLEECYILSEKIRIWISQIEPKEPTAVNLSLPKAGKAIGVAEASNGPVIHFVYINGGKIANYNVMDSLSWNLCPTTGQGQRGPVEQTLIDLPVPGSGIPVHINRAIRSFI